MDNYRNIQLGVLIAWADDLADRICNNYYEESSLEIDQKEVLSSYWKAIENKRKRISALKYIYFLVNNTKEYVVITYAPKKEVV